jgi:hypothetical protein
MKVLINEEEKKIILEMHSKEKKNNIVLEQSTNGQGIDAQLQSFITNGSVKNGKVVQMNSTNPQLQYAIEQESSKTPGKFRYLFIDKRVGTFENGTFVFMKDAVWSGQPNKPMDNTPTATTSATDIAKIKPLDSNQNKVLELLKPLNWFHEPAPTDVEVDQNLYQKLDLTGTKNVDLKNVDGGEDLVNKYSKYFPAANFDKGFFVYKKTKDTEPSVTKNNGIKPTPESCKIAIENLWNTVDKPNRYQLNDKEIADYKREAELCSESPDIFLLRFGLKNKLKDLVNSKYRIKLKSRL